MKAKKLVSDFKFCQGLINVFTIYVKCLEEYFNDEKNIEEHKELYDYFIQLNTNIKNLAIKNCILDE